ncbi:uroporphyrinogen-III C-methyltransferase [Effusibacillus dendaii]|uniref:Uroporphyrinogen-III C-methyltransferase n=1 Tax=Effusibacillus dendaii TaxID=2743772 RepID=A0A7I8D7Q4_9BACL|nr:uroporphyrinogen-III C-methyltransferase [Effusibacillus dendaii]BCJ86095.1 hypothetical protein skT53_10800 [Effusibacillus dendaii]
MQKGKVYLTGAGPGDPKLITLKGLESIQQADVLIYDRLVSRELLKYAPEHAEFVFAGKFPNHHTLRQEEINKLLVEKALAGKTVTRLKGGDPFVFGRGGEEAAALAEHGIEFEVIPGVTSAVAVPAYAGIPLTHRGIASSFCVLTGCENPEKENSAIDWARYANDQETLVILMGIGNLSLIAENLIANGRSSATPVALIHWGTCQKQTTLVGTLANIAEEAARSHFQNPAVIVIGDVVRLRERIAWFEKQLVMEV